MEQSNSKITICFLHVHASIVEKIQHLLDEQYNILLSYDTSEILSLIKKQQQNLVIILGTNVENPVHMAIIIHNICYLLPVFILALPENFCNLQRELKFNPFASAQIHLLATDAWQKLPVLLNSSLELAKDLKWQITHLNETKTNIEHGVIKTPIETTIWQEMENLPFGLIISHPDGTVCYTNEQACSLCNIQKTSQGKCSILNLFHNDEYIKLAYLMLKTKQQKCLETPVVFSTSGKIDFIEITASINNIENEDYIFLFLNNISQKIKAELQLIYQTLETEAIINAIPAAILCINNMGKIKYLNTNTEEIFKTHYPHGIKGKHLEEILPFMKKHSSVIDDCLHKKTNQTIEGVTADIFGVDQYIDIHLSPYFYHDFAGVVLKFDNITERLLKIEEKIKMEKSISLAYLSIGIAHSINNPLSGITIAITNINNRLFKKDNANMEIAKTCGCTIEQIECYMNKQNIVTMHRDILEQIHRISSIIKNTLFFGSTGIQRPMDYYNINVIIKNSIYMAKLERDINKKLLFEDIYIVEEFNNELPSLKCNNTEISLVLLHLLKNAAESLAKICTSEQQKIITVTAYIKNETCYVEVKDNGDGVKVRNPNQLFEPFFSTDCKLAGLGLAICHSIIVHHHQGKLYPKKDVSQGATFVIELPYIKPNNF